MSYEEQLDLETTYMMDTFARKPVELVRGEGMKLYDSAGGEYLDFLSGIGCVCLGHSNPAVVAAISSQAQKLIQPSNFFYGEGRGELAKRLSELLNANSSDDSAWKTFFANSGAEANEGAIKLARKYGKLHLDGAGTVLTAKSSFHGRTLATTAATGQAAKQESFYPMPSGFAHFTPEAMDELVELIESRQQAAADADSPDLAPVAVMLECVMGEGGVLPLSEGYLQDVRALTQKLGMLLIIDEVQTGFYRTGKPFAYMHAGIRPDVVTLAKGIANGYPCGTVAATGKAADVFVPGEHGTTFGGNPLVVAAASATLAELEHCGIGAHVEAIGAYFKDRLAQLPGITEVRGKGLMLAIGLKQEIAPELVNKALEYGFILNSIGTSTVRFLPPLIVSEAEIDLLIDVLEKLLAAF